MLNEPPRGKPDSGKQRTVVKDKDYYLVLYLVSSVSFLVKRSPGRRKPDMSLRSGVKEMRGRRQVTMTIVTMGTHTHPQVFATSRASYNSFACRFLVHLQRNSAPFSQAWRYTTRHSSTLDLSNHTRYSIMLLVYDSGAHLRVISLVQLVTPGHSASSQPWTRGGDLV